MTRDCPDCAEGSLVGTSDGGFACIQCGWTGSEDEAPEPTGAPMETLADSRGKVRLKVPDPRHGIDTQTVRFSPDAARRQAEALEVAADDAERREDREPMTDGGGKSDVEKKRELFTCPECGELADARVLILPPTVTELIVMRWVDIHKNTTEDGERYFYFHFDVGEVDRGGDLQRELEKVWCSECGTERVHPEDSELDPPVCEGCRSRIEDQKEGRVPPSDRETPDDRPDLDHYHRMADRQGRDPHTGGPRPDGGSLMVLVTKGSSSTSERYHADSGDGTPRCRYGNKENLNWDDKPLRHIYAWFSPCPYCYPDGHDEYDRLTGGEPIRADGGGGGE